MLTYKELLGDNRKTVEERNGELCVTIHYPPASGSSGFVVTGLGIPFYPCDDVDELINEALEGCSTLLELV